MVGSVVRRQDLYRAILVLNRRTFLARIALARKNAADWLVRVCVCVCPVWAQPYDSCGQPYMMSDLVIRLLSAH